ncbi:hypothetical protein K1719_015449 [Acacia pycnantha]|nr:hypothetical protein K1719_015449 [Acacia pycnantha]
MRTLGGCATSVEERPQGSRGGIIESWVMRSFHVPMSCSFRLFRTRQDKAALDTVFVLAFTDCLPKHFTIYGYARSKMTDAELRNMVSKTLTCRIDKRENCNEKMDEFLGRCFYHPGQYDSQENFAELDKKLKEHEGTYQRPVAVEKVGSKDFPLVLVFRGSQRGELWNNICRKNNQPKSKAGEKNEI